MRWRVLIQTLAVAAGAGLALAGPAAAWPEFGPQIKTPVSAAPLAYGIYGVQAASLRGSGKADLVVIRDPTGRAPRLSVMLSNGDGTFGTPQDVPGGQITCGSSRCPNAILAIGDFNGDGRQDVAFINSYYSVGVALGNGDGTFQPVQTLTPDNGGASDLTVGDFNGDGHLDVAVVGGGVINVFSGKGDGTFAAPKRYAFTANFVSIASGDLLGNGRTDLAAGIGADLAGNGAGVQTLLAQPDGTLAPGPLSSLPFGTQTGQILLTDLTDNRHADLVVSDASRGLLLRGLGNGAFGSAQPIVPEDVSLGSGTWATGDFNLDGHPDLAVVTSDGVDVLLGDGSGALRQLFDYPIGPTGGGPLAVGDFTGDGRPDIAVGRQDGVGVLPNVHGVFIPAPTLTTDKPCYLEGHDRIRLTALHFPAGDTVAIDTNSVVGGYSVNAQSVPVGPDGSVKILLQVGSDLGSGVPTPFDLSATDNRDGTLVASQKILIEKFGAVVTDIHGRSLSDHVPTYSDGMISSLHGFPLGTTVYAHFILFPSTFNHARHGKLRATIRLGRVSAPCGTLRAKFRSWPAPHPASGLDLWTVQFDGQRALSKRPRGGWLRVSWLVSAP
jgi:hypothetical protein